MSTTTSNVQRAAPDFPVFRDEDVAEYIRCMRSNSALSFGFSWGLLAAGAAYIAKPYLRPILTESPRVLKALVPASFLLGYISSMHHARRICYANIVANRTRNLEDNPTMQAENESAEVVDDAVPSITLDEYKPMESYEGYSSFNDTSDTMWHDELDLTEDPKANKNTISYSELRAKNRMSATPGFKRQEKRQHVTQEANNAPRSQDSNEYDEYLK